MAKNTVVITLECTESGMRNYTFRVSRKRKSGKLSLKKYCPKLRKYTIHKETK